jgi:hypothetical protein
MNDFGKRALADEWDEQAEYGQQPPQQFSMSSRENTRHQYQHDAMQHILQGRPQPGATPYSQNLSQNEDQGGFNDHDANDLAPSLSFAPSNQHASNTGTSAQIARKTIANRDQSRQPGAPSRAAGPQQSELPVRNAPAKPNSRLAFLDCLDEHAYRMPQRAGRPLNFTMVEILAMLPNWYRHGQMTHRFLNNGLNSGIHLSILQEHRKLGLSEEDERRGVNGLTDAYRKTMRAHFDKDWTRATHEADEDWHKDDLDVTNFVPDAHRTPPDLPSIPFKNLVNGITKMPDMADAGDLTQALLFALRNQKRAANGSLEDYLFPDDIHQILGIVGYAHVTANHTDGAVVQRYGAKVRNAAAELRNSRNARAFSGTPDPPLRSHKRAKIEPQTPEQQPAQMFDPRYSQQQQQQTPQRYQVQTSTPQFAGGMQYQTPDQWSAQLARSQMPTPLQSQISQQAPSQSFDPRFAQGWHQQIQQQQAPPMVDPRFFGGQQQQMGMPMASQHGMSQGMDLPNLASQYATALSLAGPDVQQENPSHQLDDSNPQACETGTSIGKETGTPSDREASPTPSEEAEAEANAARFLNVPGATFTMADPNEDPFAPSEQPDTPVGAVMNTPNTQGQSSPPAQPQIGTVDVNGVYHVRFQDIPLLPHPSPSMEAALNFAWSRMEADANARGISVFEALAQPLDLTDLPTPSPSPEPQISSGPPAKINLAAVPFENRTGYKDGKLLCECAEADDVGDQSELARAARWCRNRANGGGEYTVGHVEHVLELQNVLGDNAFGM